MKSSQGVLFLGGHPTKLMAYAVEELLTWYPFLPVEKTLQVWAQHHCPRDSLCIQQSQKPCNAARLEA